MTAEPDTSTTQPPPAPPRVQRTEVGNVYVDGRALGRDVHISAALLRADAALYREFAARLEAAAEHAETTGPLANLPVVALADMHRSRSAS